MATQVMTSPVGSHFLPVVSTFDPTFDPSLLGSSPPRHSPSSYGSKGSRFETPPHTGPGTACYVPQPSRAQLKANAGGLLSSPSRPFYYKDPLNQPFIDADGKDCGPRWVLIDPKGGDESSKDRGCVVM